MRITQQHVLYKLNWEPFMSCSIEVFTDHDPVILESIENFIFEHRNVHIEEDEDDDQYNGEGGD